MKRTKVISAREDDTSVEITIKLNTKRTLVRDEVNALAESLASSVMAIIPGTRYLHIPLSKIKVR